MTWEGWVALAAAVIAVAVLVLLLRTRADLKRQQRRWRVRPSAAAPATAGSAATEESGPGHELVAFVANPTKPGVAELRDKAVQACAARYLPEPLWFDTTAEDPGIGQTRQALEQGAKVVVAVGGDGTVRAVAEGLAGTDGAMGLIPQGTGNLLARNLELPIGETDELLRIALTGEDRRIDVGWLTVVRDESQVRDDIAEADPQAETPEETPPDAREPARDHIFLVIAGLGFDAAVMGDTDEDLKAKVGWVAYFLSGMKHLKGRQMRLEISLDDGEWRSVRLRSLLFANVGRLPGGITLIPDAEVDDGKLHIGHIDARGGIFGWAQLAGEVTMQKFGVSNDLPNKIGKIDHQQALRARVRAREPQPVEVDGDTIGEALEVSARVDPRSLTVRIPERTGSS